MMTATVLTAEPLIAVLRGHDPRKVADAAKVLVDSGIRNIEVTLTVPQAPEVLGELLTARPEAQLGMGTVESPRDVACAVEAGAQFLVSPGSSAELLEALSDSGVESMPGVMTPSEAMVAAGYGFHMLKLFPAETVGKSFLRHIKGPMPTIEWVPSGGIALTEAAEWIAAGARGVGLGALATPEDVETRNWHSIQAKARQALASLDKEAL